MQLFAAKERADQLLHLRDARRTADQHHFLNVVRRHLRVFKSKLHRFHRALQQIAHQLFEAHARQLLLHVDRAARPCGDKREIDLRLHHLRELDLGLFRCFLQPLQRHLVLAQVDAVLFLEFVNQPVDDLLVDVVAAQVGVAVGGLYFHHAAADFQH